MDEVDGALLLLRAPATLSPDNAWCEHDSAGAIRVVGSGAATPVDIYGPATRARIPHVAGRDDWETSQGTTTSAIRSSQRCSAIGRNRFPLDR